MNILLRSIKLDHFKGVKELDVIFPTYDATIFGANGSGKTTVFDAWLWLLFDRDSRGYKGADAAKTTDGADFIHQVENSVEACLVISDHGDRPEYSVTVKKTLKEIWTKPRGQETAVYGGNTTLFWVNEVPNTAGQYKAFVAGLMVESHFNILSDPSYFCTQLHWKDRLKLLLEMAGGIDDKTVAEGDPALMAMITDKGEKTFDDYRAMLGEKIRRFNKQIDEIPVRIDEANKSMVQADWAALEKQLKELCDEDDELERQRTDVAAAMKPIIEMQANIHKLELQRQKTLLILADDANKDRQDSAAKIRQLRNEVKTGEQQVIDFRHEAANCQRSIDQLELRNAGMRDEVTEIIAKRNNLAMETFTAPDLANAACPTCHQTLPTETITQQAEQMLRTWEFNKDRELSKYDSQRDSIRAQGIANNARLNQLRGDVERLTTQADSLEQTMIITKGLLAASEAELDKSKEYTAEDFASDPIIVALDAQIAALQATEIPVGDTASLEARIADVRSSIGAIQKQLYARVTNNATETRISDLRKELSQASADKAKLEGLLFQTDRFIKRRTSFLEGRINGLFTDVKFRLFKEQINGGIEECCDPVDVFTTFGKTNTAAQINAGLDIIDAIGRHLNTRVPVFVDHAESVTEIRKIDAQRILLQVQADMPLTISPN